MCANDPKADGQPTGPEKEQTIQIVPKRLLYSDYARQASESAAQATCREEKIELLEIAKAWVDLANRPRRGNADGSYLPLAKRNKRYRTYLIAAAP